MAQIKFIPIVPRKAIGILTTTREMKKAMGIETREAERLFRQVSDGFQTASVGYERSVDVIGGDLTGATFTDHERMSYLNWGTRTRWALMSSDWQSKTRPRSLARSAGAGRVLLKGRTAMQASGFKARPGIKARRFDLEVAKVRRKPFRKNMQEAIRKGTA